MKRSKIIATIIMPSSDAKKPMTNMRQVLGAFPHPSSNAGSQVSIYLGKKGADDLDQNDPVRSRAGWLVEAAERMRNALKGVDAPKASARPTVVKTATPATSSKASVAPAASRSSNSTANSRLSAVVSRGVNAGATLRPHIQDGCYIVSRTRFEADYIRVPAHEPLETWLARGYKLRMSAPGHAPSLIAPGSIRGRNDTA